MANIPAGVRGLQAVCHCEGRSIVHAASTEPALTGVSERMSQVQVGDAM